MVTQLTGLTGQLGAIAAAAPLAFLLTARLDPRRSHGLLRRASCCSSPSLLMVKDSPYRRDRVVAVKLRALAGSVRTVWGNPGTRLGMWSHFTVAVLGDRVRPAVGLPVPGAGLGWSDGGGQRPADGDDRRGPW